MTDLLATSPDTWRDRTLDAPVIPPELVPPVDATPRERNTRLLGSATTCAASGPRTSTPPPATPSAAGRCRATAPC